MDFGEKLKNWRFKNNKTQREIAMMLDISESSVAMYEANKRIPRDGLKVKFSEIMGETIENLFFKH